MAEIDIEIKAASDAAVITVVLFHLQRVCAADDVNGGRDELLRADRAEAKLHVGLLRRLRADLPKTDAVSGGAVNSAHTLRRDVPDIVAERAPVHGFDLFQKRHRRRGQTELCADIGVDRQVCFLDFTGDGCNDHGRRRGVAAVVLDHNTGAAVVLDGADVVAEIDIVKIAAASFLFCIFQVDLPL